MKAISFFNTNGLEENQRKIRKVREGKKIIPKRARTQLDKLVASLCNRPRADDSVPARPL